MRVLGQAVDGVRAIVSCRRDLRTFDHELERRRVEVDGPRFVHDHGRANDEGARSIDDASRERATGLDEDRPELDPAILRRDVDIDRLSRKRPADKCEAVPPRRHVAKRESTISVLHQCRRAGSGLDEDSVLGNAETVVDDAAGDRRGSRRRREENECEDEPSHDDPGRQEAAAWNKKTALRRRRRLSRAFRRSSPGRDPRSDRGRLPSAHRCTSFETSSPDVPVRRSRVERVRARPRARGAR